MATGSSLTQNYSRSQSEIQGDLHKILRFINVTISRRLWEDFGKRNMPGKRARRHFSQLSEFERGLIIGMKTAGWWIVRRVPLEIVGSSGHEKVPTCGKPGLERPGRPRG
ncbi:hypothetical protein TNCV_1239731 [Trichonephila clavipes]|nr:hypothetical protein TNCV_1239731 [Trichonephila clavipes]